MITSFYGSAFFSGEFFNAGGDVVPDQVHGGKDDNRRGPQFPSFKPTGLADRPRVNAKQTLADVQPPQNDDGSVRLDDAALSVPKVELRSEELLATLSSAEMRSEEVSAEIGRLLRLKLRNRDEEIMLLILIAASA